MWICLAAELFNISCGKEAMSVLLKEAIIYNDSVKKILNLQCIGSENVCKWFYF